MNPHNKFDKHEYHKEEEFLEYMHLENEEESNKTRYIEVFPKTIINKVESPDVPMDYSMNPYQGCEHGCVYCYARPTHQYWGYSSGTDFEKTILVKKNAPQLLEEKINSRSWKGEPIMLSGNTDCYQPIEQKLEITRALLKIFLKYKHPVGIITKNALIQRDLDILKKLGKDNLVKVNFSITTLDEELRRKLEPRTSSIKNRFRAVKNLSSVGIPTGVMMAPVIPGLNSDEIYDLFLEASKAGAQSAYHLIVRLNGPIGDIFKNWLTHHYPDRYEKILKLIADCHGGQINDSRFKVRVRGEGHVARSIRDMAALARKTHFGEITELKLNRALFAGKTNPQLKLEF